MIDYKKRPAAKPSGAGTPVGVRRALEQYEHWDREVAKARANNNNPTRKHVQVPLYERADAARALALATREWLDRVI